MDTDRSEPAKHVMDTGHPIDVDSITVVDREPMWRKWIVKELIWTKKLKSSNNVKIDLGNFYDDVLL